MKILVIPFLLIGYSLLTTPPAMADTTPETFSLTLKNAQKMAEENSNAIESSRYILEAAKAQAIASSSSLYPRADFNGNYFYQTHIPTQTFAGSNVKMGANDNYSIGPVVSYTLFDGGKAKNNTRSARLNADAKQQDVLSQKRDIRHSVSLTYARVQLYASNLAMTMDALKLSQGQSADIDLRFKVGTASKLDKISAHKEMLNYKLLFYQAQNDLASSLYDLFALTGETKTYNTRRPLPRELASNLAKDIDVPTLLITIDPLETTLTKLSSNQHQFASPGGETPQIKSLSLLAQSSQMASKSQDAANKPKFSISAESRTAYPDSSKQEQYNNNIFSVSVSLPLWDANQNRSLAKKYLNEAKAQEKIKAQKISDMTRDHNKATAAIGNLESQLLISQDSTKEAAEIASLTYHSYTAGKATFLEVQSANLRLMDARVNTAKIEYNLVTQLTEIEYLSGTQTQ